MAIAFFDLDKTIIKRDSIFPFLLFFTKKRVHKYPYLIFIGFCSLLYKLHFIKNQKMKEIVSAIFKNETVTSLDIVSKEFVDTYVKGLYYQDALTEIENHKKNNVKLIMVTASYIFYAKYIAEHLGFDLCVGSELWRHKDTYTGKLYGKNCYNIEKKYRLWILDYRELTDADSYAYTDSITDLPLLAFATKKICVNPDKKLAEYALKNENYAVVNWN